MDSTCAKTASHGWRGILHGRDLLKKKLGWKIGNGSSVKLWYDPWLSGSELAQPVGPAPLDSKAWLVSDLFLPDSVDWDERKIGDVLPALRETILAIKPSRFRGPDRRVWLPSKDGNYCTKSGYQVAAQGAAAEDPLLLAPSFNWFEESGTSIAPPK